MRSLALHASTQEQLARYHTQPSQAILLVGPDGIGKTAIAQALAAQTLGLDDWAEHHPYLRLVAPEKNTIPIEVIRDLQRFLQLKTAGQAPYRRAIIIEHSNSLSTEAQNAFLKTLEEPPADTLLVLTADTPRALLPTIHSRLQTITVQPPLQENLTNFFVSQGKSSEEILRAYLLSGGLPGLMHALLEEHNGAQHPLLNGVSLAKALLQQSAYERLALAERLSKQKDEARQLLLALQRIAQTGRDMAAQKNDSERVEQWHGIIKQVHAANVALQHNANTKLVLTNLFLNI